MNRRLLSLATATTATARGPARLCSAPRWSHADAIVGWISYRRTVIDVQAPRADW